ncbi:MAG: PEP-CTERM sorting domain-containing protein [Bryobacterales bacterium]|nr:PEP-CTERM sorting domain-containing protein [Bryobacterales bacterium]
MKISLRFVAMALGVSAFAQGAAFTNGDFELPGGTGTQFLGNGSTAVTGWLHTSATSISEFHASAGDWGIAAGSGLRYIGWGGSGGTGGTLSQTFDTQIGATYTVDYLLTTQQLGGSNLPVQANLVEALDGAAVLASVTNSFNMAAGNWTAGARLTFVAQSIATTLRFTDTSVNAGSINWGLDNVLVNGTSAPTSGVPEPSTYGMMTLAVAGLAWKMRGR